MPSGFQSVRSLVNAGHIRVLDGGGGDEHDAELLLRSTCGVTLAEKLAVLEDAITPRHDWPNVTHLKEAIKLLPGNVKIPSSPKRAVLIQLIALTWRAIPEEQRPRGRGRLAAAPAAPAPVAAAPAAVAPAAAAVPVPVVAVTVAPVPLPPAPPPAASDAG